MKKPTTLEFSFKKFWLPLFVFAAAVIGFYKLLDSLTGIANAIETVLSILSPFLFALIIALLLYKPVDNLERRFLKAKKKFFKKHALGFSVLISYIGFALLVAAIVYIIVPRAVISIANFVSNVPNYYNSALGYLKSHADENGKLFGIEIRKITQSVKLETILSYFDFKTVSKYISGITKATGFIVNLFLAIVVSVYMLLGRRHLVHTAGRVCSLAMPKDRVQKLYSFLARSCEIFCSYLYSQCIDGLIVALLCFIVFSIVRIPYALLMAIVMGVCNLIPYFGAIIGGFSVVIVTLICTGNFALALIALVCVVGVQQLDANVLQPRIVSQSVGIRPIYVLFAITVGNGLFGVPGLLLGVPVFAVIRMLLLDYIEQLNGKDTLLVQKQIDLEQQQSAAEPAEK